MLVFLKIDLTRADVCVLFCVGVTGMQIAKSVIHG